MPRNLKTWLYYLIPLNIGFVLIFAFYRDVDYVCTYEKGTSKKISIPFYRSHSELLKKAAVMCYHYSGSVADCAVKSCEKEE